MVNPLHFDLQSLRVFALVAEHGSLTKRPNTASSRCPRSASASPSPKA